MASKLKKGARQPELCYLCSMIQPTTASDSSKQELIHLGSYERIRKRRDCALCRLVYRFMTTTKSGTDFSHQQVVLSPRFGVNELAILCPAQSGSTPLGWIRIVHPNERIPMNERENRQDVKFTLETGQISFEQVRSWLIGCGDEDPLPSGNKKASCSMFKPAPHLHPPGKELLPRRRLSSLSMLLIDCQEDCLIEVLQDVKYVALSYVWGSWGGSEVVQTTKASLLDFDLKGILKSFGEKIPRVVRDSMSFVRGIGLRYLWCDLLCVVSDDPDLRDRQIGMMDTIYGQAFLTIIALSGSHGNMGLPGIRPGSREPVCLSETLTSGVKLLARHVKLTSFYDQSIYSRRGWTFQEELFSRRCLYVTDRQMYFKCSAAHHREDEALFGSMDQDEKHLNSFPAGYSSLTNSGHDFEMYTVLLSEYSRRQLTREQDVLRALRGITSVLEQQWYRCEFWYGIPTKYLINALHWILNDRMQYRFKDRYQSSEGSPEPLPPTWSWAAWKGRISHLPHDFTVGSHLGGFKSLIRGFLFWEDICQCSSPGLARKMFSTEFAARVREILVSISDDGSIQEVIERMRGSELNTHGWSTADPTPRQARLAIEWSKGNPNRLGDWASEIPAIRKSLPRWPFGNMECRDRNDPHNWWPSALPIPSWEEIELSFTDFRVQLLPCHLSTGELNKRTIPLCFVAPMCEFADVDIDGGQLLEHNKSTPRSTLSTSCGSYDCKVDRMRFSKSKDPLDSRSDLSPIPMTALFNVMKDLPSR
ncbi:heterokaryon incompatibility protein-domain-containing protein, partial [Phyllosticta citricarpa]